MLHNIILFKLQLFFQRVCVHKVLKANMNCLDPLSSIQKKLALFVKKNLMNLKGNNVDQTKCLIYFGYMSYLVN